MPLEDEDDRRMAVDAALKLRFVQDSTRMIEQMGIETTQLSRPLKERRRVNHFFEEWDELYRRKARSDRP